MEHHQHFVTMSVHLMIVILASFLSQLHLVPHHLLREAPLTLLSVGKMFQCVHNLVAHFVCLINGVEYAVVYLKVYTENSCRKEVKVNQKSKVMGYTGKPQNNEPKEAKAFVPPW